MGKKSLVKSTKKKAEAPKENQEAPEVAKPKAAKEKAPAKKATPKKTEAKMAPAGKADKPKAPAQKAAAKKVEPKAKPAPSLRELLNLKFSPLSTFSVEPALKQETGSFTAPEIADVFDPETGKRVKALLLQKFDLKAVAKEAAVVATPEKAEAKPAVVEKTPLPPPREEGAPKAPRPVAAKQKSPTLTEPEKPKPAETVEAFHEAQEEPPVQEDPVPDIITEFAQPWDSPEEGWENVLENTDRALATMERGLFAFMGSLRETLYGFKTAVRSDPPLAQRPWFVLGVPLAVILALLMLFTSWGNMGNYYLVPMKSGYLLKKGRFAPMGSRTVERLPGLTVQGDFAEKYSWDQAYMIVQAYYLDRMDGALKKPEGPDYQTARKFLEKALTYAPTFEEKISLRAALTRLDFDILMSQVDEALTSEAASKIREAKDLLKDATVLASTPGQKEILRDQRIRAARALQALEKKN
ncbi:MAG: hypothetical protein KKA60_06005 [Proteobacteria bacterium]|nr:hypothetical protein [Pseudomonadota bacterium]